MSTMSQLGEFLANIQNQQDARTAELEARLAELESKEECGCAETITALEERLAELESKEECGCGSYDELLASYEERISALEGNAGGGSTEGEGGDSGSTEGEGGDSGSTEPMTASQALAKYNHLIGFYYSGFGNNTMLFMSAYGHKYSYNSNMSYTCNPTVNYTVANLLTVNEGDIVKVYTPDSQEIEIIADSTLPYYIKTQVSPIAFGNMETKEVYCYNVDCANMVISPCTDEEFIAQWGNSDALGL